VVAEAPKSGPRLARRSTTTVPPAKRLRAGATLSFLEKTPELGCKDHPVQKAHRVGPVGQILAGAFPSLGLRGRQPRQEELAQHLRFSLGCQSYLAKVPCLETERK
jgi:hypothetical protein